MRSASAGCLAAIVLTAIFYATYNAWAELQMQRAPLDIDGWGHLVGKMSRDGASFAALFQSPSLWKGPVIPFVFGLAYCLYPDEYSVLALNILAFGAANGVLFIAFRRAGFTLPIVAVALLLAIFYLPHRFIFAYYYAEPVISLGSALLFLATLATFKGGGRCVALVAGMLGGALLLGRPPFLFVVVAVPLLFAIRMDSWRRPFLLYLCGFAIAFSPWVVRNYVTYREIIPFTTEGGKILFQGTYVAGDDAGMSTLRRMPEYVSLEEVERTMDPIEAYHYWQKMAIRQAIEDPVGQVRLLIRKTLHFWVYLPQGEWQPRLKTAAVFAIWLPLFAAVCWFGRKDLGVQLCATWVLGLWGFHSLVHAELRYNFPILPFAFIVAVFGVTRLIHVARGLEKPSQGVSPGPQSLS